MQEMQCNISSSQWERCSTGLNPALPPESCLELVDALIDLDMLALCAALPWAKHGNDDWHIKLVNSYFNFFS